MRSTWIVRILLAAALITPAGAAQTPTGQALFEQALARERVDGNLRDAIRLYEQVVKQSRADRGLAARALVQIGLCYEKIGHDEARRTYERLIREFGDQPDAVAQARSRLAALDTTAPGAPARMTTRQVWADKGVDTNGAPSSDGRFLSFVDWETGDLAVRDLSTGENRRVTSKGSWAESPDFAETSAIAPDGRQIAYAWYTSERYELRVTPISVAKPRTLVAASDVQYVQVGNWTSDSTRVLAALDDVKGVHALVLVNVSNGATQTVKQFTDWRWPNRAAVSPDGHFVVYELPASPTVPTRDLYLVDVANTTETRLTDHPANDEQPIWTPDGRHILFLSDRTGTMGAWLLDIDNGKPSGAPRQLKADMSRAAPMGFTRAGTLVYALFSGLRDIYVAEIDPAAPRLLAQPSIAVQAFTGGNSYPDWSPDGTRIAYLSQRDLTPSGAGANLLCIAPAAGGPVEEIWLPFSHFQRPRWSPDGTSLVVTGLLRGRFGVYRVDPRSKAITPVKIRMGLGTVYAPVWWPDGRSILYSEGVGQETRFVRRDLDTEREQILLKVPGGGGGDAAPSPDGRFVAVRVWEPGPKPNSALEVLRADGSGVRELVRAPITGMSGIAWTPDGRYVLYVRASDNGKTSEVWRVNVDTGETQFTGLAHEGMRDLRLARDGRHIAFGAGEWRTEVWVLENALRPAAASPARTR